jgi:hypothetical protein
MLIQRRGIAFCPRSDEESVPALGALIAYRGR